MAPLERRRAASRQELRDRANWIRARTIELVDVAKSGHYSSVFSCAELLAVLYYRVLRLDPEDPAWPQRDRLVLGKGHAAIGVYPILADLGFFPAEWLETYTRLGSNLGDHPDMRKVPGVDFSSGSIGHNLSVGVGIAIANRLAGIDSSTWVLLGDGELNEGQVWEAAMSAAHFQLDRLVAIVDANAMAFDGPVDQVMSIEPITAKFEAFGWKVSEIDGHDLAAIEYAFAEAEASSTPHAVIARTVKGKGVSFMESTPAWHLGYLGPIDKARALAELEEART